MYTWNLFVLNDKINYIPTMLISQKFILYLVFVWLNLFVPFTLNEWFVGNSVYLFLLLRKVDICL